MFFHHFHMHPSNTLDQNYLHELVAIISSRSKTRIPRIPDNIQSTLTSFSDIKLVLFDIYGTLLHSAAGDIHQKSNMAHTLFEVEPLSLKISSHTMQELLLTHISHMHAETTQKYGITYPEVDAIALWQKISEDARFPLSPLDEKQAALCAVHYELYNNPSCAMPHTIEILNELHNRGIMLGIVSNAQFYTPLFMQATFSNHPQWDDLHFPVQTWSYHMREAKPSTSLFTHALHQAKKHHITPSQILYVGNDMRNDIWPAQKMGLHTTLFAGDSLSYRPRTHDHSLTSVHPDATVTSLLEIGTMIS